MSDVLVPRNIVGSTLAEIAEKDPAIVVLDADFYTCTITEEYKDKFPDRFVEVGIAEQNMMGIAAGLATAGMKPFASALAAFCTRRACDQVTTSIALQNLNVKILGVYPGLFVGKNGGSHQALEDLAITRAIARMSVVQPADAWELMEVLYFAARHTGPMYIRISREPSPRYIPDNYTFQLGKSSLLRQGTDITIMAYGELIPDTLEAAEFLSIEHGIKARVLNMSSLKPIDTEATLQAARETNCIVTVDNHNIIGGLGSAVAEYLSEVHPTRVKRIGVRDVFGRSGSNAEMKRKFGVSAEAITGQILDYLN
jgi:transketolase